MLLNGYGKIAEDCLQEIPNHFENTEISSSVVMPNHVHAIIGIYDEFFKSCNVTSIVEGTHDFDKRNVGQRYIFDLQKEGRKYQKLPVIVSTYKAAVTREINRIYPDSGFKWQTSFYDHIIRTETALQNIAGYIELNPSNWHEDLENENYRCGLSEDERQKVIKDYYQMLFRSINK